MRAPLQSRSSPTAFAVCLLPTALCLLLPAVCLLLSAYCLLLPAFSLLPDGRRSRIRSTRFRA
ncbi:MAG: hypothetical protein DMG25_07695 [Acidobacteria bacterium]|nr:MAG: hypothetical protein DMG25_07695 [Acidobacteriota bacterium]PYV26914.1 MAG: hypothetical protein DMG27_05395 [Acidobacteriota bacterium]